MPPESRIFKNEEMLSPEYLPDILPHRETQIKQLAGNLLPASTKRKPQNTLIFGAPGIGKTASVKYVFREFENYSGIKTIYINCWDFKTPTAVLSKITTELGYIVQRKGWAKDEVVARTIETINKLNKVVIVCLDEVDQLQQETLYDLLRLDIKNHLGLILISNDPFVFANAEPRIKSSLAVDEIEFKPYSLQEMKAILQERVKYSVRNVENGVVLLAANHAVQKGGDVRIGLQCLLKAGRNAEQENADKIKVEHVKNVLKEVRQIKPEILKEKINDAEREILVILGKDIWLSGDLYRKYCETYGNPVTDRSFRGCISHLEQLKLIRIRKRKIGNARVISKA